MARSGRSLAALVLATSLGCGGGGGSSGGGSPPPEDNRPVTPTYEQEPALQVSFSDTLEPVCAAMAFTPFPENVTAIRFQDPAGAFLGGEATFSRVDADTVVVCFPVDPALATGRHTGTLVLTLCKDAACLATRTLVDPTLDYRVDFYRVQTGLPPLEARFQVDRIAATPDRTGTRGDVPTYGFDLASGQRLEIDIGAETAIYRLDPVPGVPEALLGFEYVVYMLNGIAYRYSLPSGASHAAIVLTGRATDGRKAEVTVDVTP